MKRLLAFVLALCLCRSAWLLPVGADDTPIYRIALQEDKRSTIYFSANATAEADLDLLITLDILEDPGTYAMELTMKLDAPLQLISGELSKSFCFQPGYPTGAVGSGFYADSNKLIWVSDNKGHNAEPFEMRLPFAEFMIRIPKGTAAGQYHFFIDPDSMLICDETRTPYTVSAIPFTVVLEAKETDLFGDINCDGVISIADLVMTARYAAEDETMLLPSAQGIYNADCVFDGKINSNDITALARYLAHLIPAEALGPQR